MGADAAQRVYGIQNGKLAYPVGTSEGLALQDLDLSSVLANPDGSKYYTEVTGFSTNLECEILPLKNATKRYLPWFSIQAPYFVVNITTDSCRINNAIVGQGADHGYYKDNNATQNYQGLFQNFTCNTGGDSSAQYPLAGNTSADHRFLMSMVSLQWLPHMANWESQSIWENQLTCVLCKPTYSIDKYSVSYSQDQSIPIWESVKIPGTNSSLEGFQEKDLTLAVQTTLANATFGQGGSDFVVVTVPSFFQLMERSSKSGLAPFMDPNILLDVGSRTYKELSTQIAQQYLTKAENVTIFGSSSYKQDRLQVKRLTVGLMSTCLGLTLCFSVLELFVRPWNSVSCDPNSISSLAVILAASKNVREILSGTGSATLTAISYRLSREKFQSVISRDEQDVFSLERVSQSKEPDGDPSSILSGIEFEWWRPVSLKYWFAAIAVVIPISLIILLEVFQRMSDRNKGLLDLDSSSIDSRILSAYLPAFVMLCVATLYSSLDFNVSLFTPFTALKHGNTSATRSIAVNLVGKLPPHALLLSLRGWHVAPCLTILAGFASSFLTIVVSGLYTSETVTKFQTASLQQLDCFNFTHIDLSSDDGFAGSITNLIQYSNVSYPEWTYDNLVLPSLSAISTNASTPTNQSASILVTIPAFRGSLDCSLLPSDSIKVDSVGAMSSCLDCNDLVQINYAMNLSYDLCGQKYNNLTHATWNQIYVVPNDSSRVYAGKGTNLQWYMDFIIGDGYVEPVDNSGGLDVFNEDTDNYYPGCPSFAFSFGTASAGQKTKKTNGDGRVWNSHTNISIMYCYQRLEQVMTNVTLSYPSLTVNSTIPPVPLEHTARNLTNSLNNAEYWFDISLNTMIGTLKDLGISVTARNNINPFVQALIWGKDGIPIDKLYNQGNMSIFATAANNLYRQYIAQAISATMRTTLPQTGQTLPLQSGDTLPTYEVTLSYQTQRLVQQRSPKITLQAILAFMVVCAIGGYVIADMKRVLPHNPCSIAGTMSLLADSEICRTRNFIPLGSEWKSKKTLRREGIFAGWVFRMGWWKEGGGRLERRFGIDADSRASNKTAGKNILYTPIRP